MRLRTVLILSAASAAALIVPSAASASAAAPTLAVAGHYESVPNGGQRIVHYGCEATAATAAAVVITRCGIFGSIAGPALPGPLAGATGISTIPDADFSLCWSATAIFLDGSSKTVAGCESSTSSPGGRNFGAGVSTG